MRKKSTSVMVSLAMSLILILLNCILDCGQLTVYAAAPSADNIKVNNEYVIPDGYDWCTFYVVVATNNTGKDITINAEFTAVDKNGNVVAKSQDYSDAVKKDQQFILYGQFKNVDIQGVSNFRYSFNVGETDNCTYNSVDIDAVNNGECLQVSATNYSEHDIQGVGVRTVFLKNGKAVGFDTVNIADVGYTFHGGSTNSQVVGHNTAKYDTYILTYTSAGNDPLMDF
ncbi:hypothetical protein [Butyrivibrio sp. VCB2006]|uniref:hypothetical protein n=1 Tax=Butyrivibrio sp. VCB2006 TaxID=1280679 RepID=UPI0003F53F6A|nr:hypothetical protein [Butyrivibrio sp. VCB2006]